MINLLNSIAKLEKGDYPIYCGPKFCCAADAFIRLKMRLYFTIIILTGVIITVLLLYFTPISPRIYFVKGDLQNLQDHTVKDEVENEILNNTVVERVKMFTNCVDRMIDPKLQQRGEYWVLHNYVRGEKVFKCHDSITYTTHGDYTFLDNLITLTERWQGPVSLALHAPGTDFEATVDSIWYLRDCSETNLVRDYVSFHIYFHRDHVPDKLGNDDFFKGRVDCSQPPPFFNVSSEQLYKNQNELLYPVNVGRNIARQSAQTHFVLASDIELFPSLNLIQDFLAMIARNERPLLDKKPKVFPISLFEVESDQLVPKNKTELLSMINKKVAIPFHKSMCSACHSIPKGGEWLNAAETNSMEVFTVGKRVDKFKQWEPIYVGTNAEPLYEERLSWEGKRDKMTQGYTLCVLDYNFLVLNNAFLVHRPGIKHYKSDARRDKISSAQSALIDKKIMKELKILFGEKEGCVS